MVFEALVTNLHQIGFFRFFASFVLTLAITWGALQKTNLLGENLAVLGVVSTAFAFLVVGGLVGQVPATIMPALAGSFSVFVIAIFGIMIALGVAKVHLNTFADQKWVQKMLFIVGAGIAIVTVLPYIFPANINIESSVQFVTNNPALFLGLVIILSFTLLAWTPGAGGSSS